MVRVLHLDRSSLFGKDNAHARQAQPDRVGLPLALRILTTCSSTLSGVEQTEQMAHFLDPHKSLDPHKKYHFRHSMNYRNRHRLRQRELLLTMLHHCFEVHHKLTSDGRRR